MYFEDDDTERLPGKQEWPELTVEQLQIVRPTLVNYYYAMRSCQSDTYKHYEKLVSELDMMIEQKQAAQWLEENENAPSSHVYCL